MATYTWVSKTGDISAAASWNPAVVPTLTSDILIFDSYGVSPRTNLSAVAGPFLKVIVRRSCPFDIGGIGNEWQMAASQIFHFGQGAFWLNHNDPSGANTNILWVDCIPNGRLNFVGTSAGGFMADRAYLRRGDCILRSAMIADKVQIGHAAVDDSSISVRIEKGIGAYTDLTIKSGIVHSFDDNAARTVIDGGFVRIEKPGGHITSIQNGGDVLYQGENPTGLTSVIGGVFEVVDATISVLLVGPDATIKKGQNATITTRIDVIE